MKNLKILTLTLLFAGISGAGFAQNKEQEKINPEAMADKHVERIAAVVDGLTDQQKKQLKDAQLEQHEAMKSFFEEQKEQREATRGKMMELRDQRRESLKQVLTKDQYIQYLEKSLDNRQKHQFRGRTGDRKFKGKGRHEGKSRRDRSDSQRRGNR